MKRSPVGAVAVLAVLLEGIACGGGNQGTPVAPTGSAPTCRIFPTAFTNFTTFTGGTATEPTTCTFNMTTNQLSCTGVYSDTTGTVSTTTRVTHYDSRADIVDEVRVVPPLRLSSRVVVTGAGNRGPINSTVTYTYDAQRRLVREVGTAGFTTTYTAWDNEGRPVAGSTAVGGLNAAVSISNDAAARTQVRIEAGVACTMTFDANGNQVAFSCPGSTATLTIASTQSICR